MTTKGQKYKTYSNHGETKKNTPNRTLTIGKGDQEKIIDAKYLELYIALGWDVVDNTIGNISVVKGRQEKKIDASKLDFYLSDGWVEGYIVKGIVAIIKDGKMKYIDMSELDIYLNDGWVKSSAISKSTPNI